MLHRFTRRNLMAIGFTSIFANFDNKIIAKSIDTAITPNETRFKLLQIEAEAAQYGVLSINRAPLPPLTSTNVYLESLPLLVDLIESTVSNHPSLAQKSAILLGQLNLQERVTPAYLMQVYGLRAPPLPYQSVEKEYTALFKSTQIRPERIRQVNWYVDRLVKNRPRYETVSNLTNVPWHVIGVTHALEASFNFLGHLHNGDVPLSARTRNVPVGRPQPWSTPYSWERSAIDALQFEHLVGVNDWSLPRTLYRLEGYNGYGYRSKKINSPYLWGFSNHYESGKYVKDRVWSSTAVSQQCGAAVMIHGLLQRGAIKI